MFRGGRVIRNERPLVRCHGVDCNVARSWETESKEGSPERPVVSSPARACITTLIKIELTGKRAARATRTMRPAEALERVSSRRRDIVIANT